MLTSIPELKGKCLSLNCSMKITFIHHIVLIVKNIAETEKYYTGFLGQPAIQNEGMLIYTIGETKVFFVLPKGEYEVKDKDKGGLNHIAFGVHSLDELKHFEGLLTQASIRHSGIKTGKQGGTEYIWMDDPDNIRIEIYYSPS